MNGERWGTNRILAALAGGLATLALVGGDTPAPGGGGAISALDFAEALRDDPDAVVVLDVRDAAAFEEFHAPRAMRIAPAAIDDAAGIDSVLTGLGVPGESLIVVTGGPRADPRPVWLSLRRAGYAQAHYVPDILTAWVDEIISPVLSPDAGQRERKAWERQAELSRYFGGFPRIAAVTEIAEEDASARLRKAKRRGCAF